MLGVVALVLGFEVEELDLGDDADGGEGFFFQQADGELGALDELLDKGAAVLGEEGLEGGVGLVLGFADVDVDARAGINGLDGQGADGGDGVGVVTSS